MVVHCEIFTVLRDGRLSTSTIYQNAPLVELIVELRWHVDVSSPLGGPQFVTHTSASFDQWFNRFSSKLESQGYVNLERLVPHDFPALAYQPIYRYKRKHEAAFPLIQFGHGIFTMNAGPPNYIDWEGFRPEVESGIKALVSSIPETGGINILNSASVRYIDAFGEELRNGKSGYRFMREELKASVELPVKVLELADKLDEITPTIALRFPVKDRPGHQLFLQIADGRLNNTPATVMEMNYLVHDAIPLVASEILGILDNSRNTLHDTFEAMIDSIRDRLRPKFREEK